MLLPLPQCGWCAPHTLYLHLTAVPVSKLVSLAAAQSTIAVLRALHGFGACTGAHPLKHSGLNSGWPGACSCLRRSRLPRNELHDEQLEGGRDWGEENGTACGSSWRPGGLFLFMIFVLNLLRWPGSSVWKKAPVRSSYSYNYLSFISHLGPSHFQRVSASLFGGSDHPMYPSLFRHTFLVLRPSKRGTHFNTTQLVTVLYLPAWNIGII